MKLRKYVFYTLGLILISAIIILNNALHLNEKTNEHKMIHNYDRNTITDSFNNSNEGRINASEYTRGNGFILLPTPDGTRQIIINGL